MSESIRETLQAAMRDGAESAPPAAIETQSAAPVETAPQAAAPEGHAPAAGVETQDPKPSGAPERDEHGRFRPKQEGAVAAAPAEAPKPDEIETAKPAEGGPETQATAPPPSLPAAVKAIWEDLKPEVQQAFRKLEDTVQTAKAEWGRKGERLNRFDEILGPHVDRWRAVGLDEVSGIQTLLAAQAMLDRNPIDGILQIARSYGMTPQHLAQSLGLPQTSAPPTGQEGQQAPTAIPDVQAALQPFMQRVQTLEQQLQQQRSASEAAAISEARAEVEAFRADPANLYFDNVRDDVSRRLEVGAAKTLAEAYEQAIWASAEVRPHLLAAQAKQAAADAAKKAAEEAQRTKAAQASHAAGSVTGSPTPGAQPLTPGPQPHLRDELKANLAAARASV